MYTITYRITNKLIIIKSFSTLSIIFFPSVDSTYIILWFFSRRKRIGRIFKSRSNRTYSFFMKSRKVIKNGSLGMVHTFIDIEVYLPRAEKKMKISYFTIEIYLSRSFSMFLVNHRLESLIHRSRLHIRWFFRGDRPVKLDSSVEETRILGSGNKICVSMTRQRGGRGFKTQILLLNARLKIKKA